MSRIDKALQLWEQSNGAATPTVEPTAVPTSAGRTSLGGYAPETNSPAEGPSGFEGEGAPAAPFASTPRPPASDDVHGAATPVGPSQARKSKKRHDPDGDARLVSSELNAVSVEQYRRLAAALHEAQAESGLKTVMLTSAVPHEGKTLTTVNLALTLTESYARRVLIIDADLRWPSVHTVLRIGNARGLSEALAEDHLELPIKAVSDRLSVLTAGRPGPSPLAGLSSPRMGVVLEECARRFDWVLLDTPPVGMLSDAQLLARLAGAVILVIGAGSTPAATIERAVAEIGPECIIGTVLNRVDERQIIQAGYYDGYYDRNAAE